MKKFILPVLASLAVAAPAMAGEARVEARSGIIWDGSGTEDFWGMAAGYDFDLDDKAFLGLEVSGDKIGASGMKVAFGFTGRAGVKVLEQGKLFVDTGYTTEPCTGCDGAVHFGGGYQHAVTDNVYVKVAYRRFFYSTGSDLNAATAGVGFKF